MFDPILSRRSSLRQIAAGLGGLAIAQDASGATSQNMPGSPSNGMFASIAALRAGAVPDGTPIVSVQGYHSPDRPQGGGRFLWSPSSNLPDNGGTVIRPQKVADKAPGRWIRFDPGPATVHWFGAIGDGEADDTAAIQQAIDATRQDGVLIFPRGRYRVTTLDTGRCETTWRFDHAELVGSATRPTTCILRVQGLHSRFFDVRINVQFNKNYTCALWWYNEASPSQHNEFYGLDIRYGIRGIVYGALPGKVSTQLAQSENNIFGYHSRGVQRPLYMNHDNGVLCLIAPHLVAHDEEWERDMPGQFDRTANRAFEAVSGVLIVQGGEVQNSIAAATSECAAIDGGEVYLDGCIIEVSAPFGVRGRLTIRGGRVLNTQSMTNQFMLPLAASESAKLQVSECHLFRNPRVGSFSDRSLITGIGGSVLLSDCEITEWADFVPLVTGNSNRALFRSCRWRPQGASGPDYRLDTAETDLLEWSAIDRGGGSTEGLYPWGGNGGSSGTSSDVPDKVYRGSHFLKAGPLAGLFTADPTSLETLRKSAVRISGGDRLMIEAWVRCVSGKDVGLSMLIFDTEGRLIRSGQNAYHVICGTYQNFIADTWRNVRQLIEIPVRTAAYAGFGVHAVNGEIRFCGLRVRRADWVRH